MAVTVYTREEWKAETARRRVRADRQLKADLRAIHRRDRWGAFGDFLRCLFHFGMVAQAIDGDPTRAATYLLVQEQVDRGRQITATQRAEDEARAVEHARILAREMAREMVAEVERQRRSR